ncbi:MAG: hypothetical protein HS111_10675 [Kofleriaceae bacterium]|nr:hypothetical protein [Kofleriaceae bacterium]
MSSPRPVPRALRIGVVLSGTLVAEHVVPGGTAFTIGQSIRNLVPLPVSGLPRRWQLLELVERGVLLRLGPGMDARVSAGGELWGRAELDARGAPTRRATLVTLPAGSHGKVALGEVTVLFQEQRAAPPAPVPALPRAVRGTLAERVDRRLAMFAAASLLLHGGVMTAAHLHDAPGRSSLAARARADYVADTVAIIDADDPLLDLEPRGGDAAAPAPAAATAPAPAAPASAAPGDRAPTPPARRGRAARPGRGRHRVADLLFADTGAGTVDAHLARRRPGTDLARQLAEVRDADARVAIGNPDGDRLRGDGPRWAPAATPRSRRRPRSRADDDKAERVPPTRITVAPQPLPPGPPRRIDHVVEKIRTTYLGGLQRCYRQALGREPALAGKVRLTFTLTEKGAVSDGEARSVDPASSSASPAS